MPAILNQRKFLLTKRFEITGEALKIGIKSPISYVEDEFTFEELGTKVTRHKKPYIPTLIAFFITFGISILLLFAYFNNSKQDPISEFIICLSVCSLTGFLSMLLYNNSANLYLYDGRVLAFYANSPTKKEVDNFLTLLKEKQKGYLLNRYAKIDPYISPEQLSSNLKWLREKNIIDDTELTALQIKILPKPGGNVSVGFKITKDQ